MTQIHKYSAISLSKLHHYLLQDPYYGVKNSEIASVIEEIYNDRLHDRTFDEFKRRYLRWPCKTDAHRHLIYLWIGLGLPAYRNGSRIGWDFEVHDSLEYWLQDFNFDPDELKSFLREKGFVLPVYFYPDDPDNSQNKMGQDPIEFEIARKKIVSVSNNPSISIPSDRLRKLTTKNSAPTDDDTLGFTPHPLAIFHLMDNLRFKEIEILIDPENMVLRISARKSKATSPFSAIGLTKKNEITLNRPGKIFMSLANQSFNSNAPGAMRALRRLSKSLRNAFNTPDTPILKTKPQFRISIPKDDRAKQQAIRRTDTYDDNRITHASTDADAQTFFETHDPEYNHKDELYSDDPDLGAGD